MAKEFIFTVLTESEELPDAGKYQAFLISQTWDDYSKYETLHVLYVFDAAGDRHRIGKLKIGQFNLKPSSRKQLEASPRKGYRYPDVPKTFNTLGDDLFSLGEDESYYQKLRGLGDALKITIVDSLNDLAYKEQLWLRAKDEQVSRDSLLRFVSRTTVENQFRRLLAGGAKLTPYAFEYIFPKRTVTESEARVKLQFEVSPHSSPPTNIHVLIGSNGVGKTYVLGLMAKALVTRTAVASQSGRFRSLNGKDDEPLFASVISVSFSAFDIFIHPISSDNDASTTRYNYIGLRRPASKTDGTKSPKALEGEFVESLKSCFAGSSRNRWLEIIKSFESDPLFTDEVGALLEQNEFLNEEQLEVAAKAFRRMGSGHKIVLLTITRLVELVEEKTLVLFDEPETHLHPPLLSAFARAISKLLVSRNGVAIIATHSPVVLQEVPSNCVLHITRDGDFTEITRPEDGLETFGENVGTLTREIFELEVTHSGFIQLVREAANRYPSYEDALEHFDSHLGTEARAILRGIYARKRAEEV